MPCTKYFRIAKARTNIGAMMMMPAAERRFQRSPSSPLNSASPIGSVTASFGLTALKAAEKYEDLIERVDQLLYSAKNSGKNCIVSG